MICDSVFSCFNQGKIYYSCGRCFLAETYWMTRKESQETRHKLTLVGLTADLISQAPNEDTILRTHTQGLGNSIHSTEY